MKKENEMKMDNEENENEMIIMKINK